MNIRTIATAAAISVICGPCYSTVVELRANTDNRSMITFQGTLDGTANPQDTIHISCSVCQRMPGSDSACAHWSNQTGAITGVSNGSATVVQSPNSGIRYTLTPNRTGNRMMTFQGYVYCPTPKTSVIDGSPLYNTVSTEILGTPKKGWGDIIWGGDVTMVQTAPLTKVWYGTEMVSKTFSESGALKLHVVDELVIAAGETKPVVRYVSGTDGAIAGLGVDASSLPDLRCWVSGGKGDWTLGPTEQLLCRHEMRTKKAVAGNLTITATIR